MIPDEDISDRIRAIVEDEGDTNFKLHILRFRDLPDGCPVVIIVHPGDASGEPGIRGPLDNMTQGLEWAAEDPATRFIILHRFSSSYDGEFGENSQCDDWFEKIREVGVRADHLYGDQLDQFCDWFRSLGVTPETILVTGLWGDPDDGCAAAVARGLADLGAVLSNDCPLAWDRDDLEP